MGGVVCVHIVSLLTYMSKSKKENIGNTKKNECKIGPEK